MEVACTSFCAAKRMEFKYSRKKSFVEKKEKPGKQRVSKQLAWVLSALFLVIAIGGAFLFIKSIETNLAGAEAYALNKPVEQIEDPHAKCILEKGFDQYDIIYYTMPECSPCDRMKKVADGLKQQGYAVKEISSSDLDGRMDLYSCFLESLKSKFPQFICVTSKAVLEGENDDVTIVAFAAACKASSQVMT